MSHFHGWSGFSCMADDNVCRKLMGGTALGANIVMILMIIVWSGGLSTLAFLCLKRTGMLRIDEECEAVGMDSRHHSPPKAGVCWGFLGECGGSGSLDSWAGLQKYFGWFCCVKCKPFSWYQKKQHTIKHDKTPEESNILYKYTVLCTNQG